MQFQSTDEKAHYDYNIQAAMKNGLMIGCDFVVTPWYTVSIFMAKMGAKIYDVLQPYN